MRNIVIDGGPPITGRMHLNTFGEHVLFEFNSLSLFVIIHFAVERHLTFFLNLISFSIVS